MNCGTGLRLSFLKDVWWSGAIDFDSKNFGAFERTPAHLAAIHLAAAALWLN
jgi:hypothetical protein